MARGRVPGDGTGSCAGRGCGARHGVVAAAWQHVWWNVSATALGAGDKNGRFSRGKRTAATTEHFFYLAGVLPWAPGMTSATIGYTLWNRQHKDDDLALTVLVALGAPHGGGEFAHAEHGYAHAVRNGAILVVNPLAVHGTAEFDYLPGDDMRIMVAFFVKSSVVKGMATGASHGRACGLAVPPACKPTHRGKGQ